MSTLEPDTVRARLSELDGWRFEDGAIRRRFTFDGFREAVSFINRVADLADAANHHPELTNVYATVDVVLTTHDAGGVTEKDLSLAAEIDQVA